MQKEYAIDAVQAEYTMLAPYAGDVLVEHDVTFDLYRQMGGASLARRWDHWRWRRFETGWLGRYRKVVVMSERDAKLLGRPNVAVIPNGVDLARFAPEIERPGQRLLFVGSFRHFPNVIAYRFFVDEVWPIVRESLPEITLTVVAGPDPLLYWRERTGLLSIPGMIASACWSSWAMSGRFTWRRISYWSRPWCRRAPISKYWKRWRWNVRWSLQPSNT